MLTLGSVNAYINGGAAMAGHLTRPQPGGNAAQAHPAPLFLAAVAASGLLLITLYGLGLVSPAALVAIPTTLFLAVYLGSMLAAVRVLRGPARLAAVPASVAVVVLACCGWALSPWRRGRGRGPGRRAARARPGHFSGPRPRHRPGWRVSG